MNKYDIDFTLVNEETSEVVVIYMTVEALIAPAALLQVYQDDKVLNLSDAGFKFQEAQVVKNDDKN